jgi:hypothetical protein
MHVRILKRRYPEFVVIGMEAAILHRNMLYRRPAFCQGEKYEKMWPGNGTDTGTGTMNGADIARCAKEGKDTGTLAEDVTTGAKDTGDVSV